MPNFRTKPIAGLNLEDNTRLVDATQVTDASNFLFENGEAVMRPGCDVHTVTGISAAKNIVFAKSLPIGEVPTTILITLDGSTYEIWTLSNVDVATLIGTITGGLGAQAFHNAEAIDGDILFPNAPSGITRLVLPSTLSQISAAKYRYVSSHASRAIAAYDITSGSENPRKVAWSTTADVTDWTGPGSGSLTLQDAIDDITGIGVVQNIWIVARRNGFHLLYNTGVSIPTFRSEVWDRNGIGVAYPASFDVDGNSAFFIGRDDVYSFALAPLERIGRDIRKELFEWIHEGVEFRGFVSRSVKRLARHYYNLVPINTSATAVPHFVHNIEEGTWSKHHYNFVPNDGFERLRDFVANGVVITLGTVAVLDEKNICEWDPNIATEREATLRSKTFVLGTARDVDAGDNVDAAVRRFMLSHRGSVGDGDVTVKLEAQTRDQDGHVITKAVEVAKNLNVDVGNINKWSRDWFNLVLNGQDFVYDIKVPAGYRLAIDEVGIVNDRQGTHVE